MPVSSGAASSASAVGSSTTRVELAELAAERGRARRRGSPSSASTSAWRSARAASSERDLLVQLAGPLLGGGVGLLAGLGQHAIALLLGLGQQVDRLGPGVGHGAGGGGVGLLDGLVGGPLGQHQHLLELLVAAGRRLGADPPEPRHRPAACSAAASASAWSRRASATWASADSARSVAWRSLSCSWATAALTRSRKLSTSSGSYPLRWVENFTSVSSWGFPSMASDGTHTATDGRVDAPLGVGAAPTRLSRRNVDAAR